jgi:hypothetical protein
VLTSPEQAEELFKKAEKQAKEKYEMYKNLQENYKPDKGAMQE